MAATARPPTAAMESDNPLDETTLVTLSLLESRLLRAEHLLYGRPAAPSLAKDEPAARKMLELERRFSLLQSRIRVYAELLKICTPRPLPQFFERVHADTDRCYQTSHTPTSSTPPRHHSHHHNSPPTPSNPSCWPPHPRTQQRSLP
jgi:hypothetical protein